MESDRSGSGEMIAHSLTDSQDTRQLFTASHLPLIAGTMSRDTQQRPAEDNGDELDETRCPSVMSTLSETFSALSLHSDRILTPSLNGEIRSAMNAWFNARSNMDLLSTVVFIQSHGYSEQEYFEHHYTVTEDQLTACVGQHAASGK